MHHARMAISSHARQLPQKPGTSTRRAASLPFTLMTTLVLSTYLVPYGLLTECLHSCWMPGNPSRADGANASDGFKRRSHSEEESKKWKNEGVADLLRHSLKAQLQLFPQPIPVSSPSAVSGQN